MSKHKHKHVDEDPPVPAIPETPEADPVSDAPAADAPAEDTASDDGMPEADSGVDVSNYADADDGTEGEAPFST